MNNELIEKLPKKACPKVTIKQACRVLDMSRSGYYAHRRLHKQRYTPPQVCAANAHLKATFAASHKAYGSRRLQAAMVKRVVPIGRYRVRTLMRCPRHPMYSTGSLIHPSLITHGCATSPTSAHEAGGFIWPQS